MPPPNYLLFGKLWGCSFWCMLPRTGGLPVNQTASSTYMIGLFGQDTRATGFLLVSHNRQSSLVLWLDNHHKRSDLVARFILISVPCQKRGAASSAFCAVSEPAQPDILTRDRSPNARRESACHWRWGLLRSLPRRRLSSASNAEIVVASPPSPSHMGRARSGPIKKSAI